MMVPSPETIDKEGRYDENQSPLDQFFGVARSFFGGHQARSREELDCLHL